MEAASQNYRVLVEDKWARKVGEAGPSNKYDTRRGPKKNDGGPTSSYEKERMKFASFRLISEIEKTTDLERVVEERILDSTVELSLREVLKITKKEFHDLIIDLVKRKRLSTEQEPDKLKEIFCPTFSSPY